MSRTKQTVHEVQHPEGVDHAARRRKVADYDPSEFFVPSSDEKGHNDQFRFRSLRAFTRRMNEVLASKKFPFTTATDVMRYCMWIGLKRLDHLEPVSTIQGQINLVRELLMEAEFQQTFADTFVEAERVINRYLEQDDRGAARNLVGRMLNQIKRMPGETNWQAKYEKRLQDKFGWILRAGEGRKMREIMAGVEAVGGKRE